MSTTSVVTDVIEVRELPPLRGACLQSVTEQDKLGPTLGSLYEQLASLLRAHGLRGGSDFAVYPDPQHDPQHLTVVAGIAIDGEVPPNDAGIEHREYGGGRSVVATMHGPYSADGTARIGQAWQEAWRFVGEHGFRPSGPPYEIYLVGFGDTEDQQAFVTELVIPIS